MRQGISDEWAQEQFMGQYAPRLERVARGYFRHLRGGEGEDLVQEVLALGWADFRRMLRKGKDPGPFVGIWTIRLCHRANRGSRIAGGSMHTDLLDRGQGGRRRPGPSDGQDRDINGIEDAADSRSLIPAEQAAFRLDLADWLDGLGAHARGAVLALLAGANGQEAARAAQVSPGRLSQLRAEWHSAWEERFGYNLDRTFLARLRTMRR